MASPQTERGFVMLALDLFCAVMAAGLNNYEAIVLSEILIQHYGPSKRREAFFDPVDFGERSGIGPKNARRALKSLLKMRFVSRSPEGGARYRFVKDYESWEPMRGHLDGRLGGRLLRWIAGVLDRFIPARNAPSNKQMLESTQTPLESTQTPLEGGSDKCLESTQTLFHAPKESTQTPQGIRTSGGRGEYGSAGVARASEDKRDGISERERGFAGAGAGAREGAEPEQTPEPIIVLPLAERITVEVFGLKDPDGGADPNVARIVASYITPYSERAVMAAAAEAVLRKPSNPVRYFRGMCEKGLTEPPTSAPAPQPTVNGTPSPAPRRTAGQERMEALKAKIRAGEFTPKGGDPDGP